MPDNNISFMFFLSIVGVMAVGVFVLQQFFIRRIKEKDSILKEMTDRVALQEQQLFHGRNELNAILSSMVEGVIVIGANDRILYVSPNAADMFQLRSKELVGKAYWEVIPFSQINSSIKDALKGCEAVNKEITLIAATDSSFSMQISPVMQEGKLTSVVVVFHNITDLKNLIKMRSEFVANVSHELKTPLTSIKGFVETLSQDDGLTDPVHAKKFLGIIYKQTQRLEMLVNDLLILSSIESKEIKMDFVVQELSPIILSVIAMHKKALEKGHLSIDVDIPEDLPKISMDRNQIEQVFINLLDNAIKYTPSGGAIDISARSDGTFVRIEIKDTGLGIAPEHLSRIFERFYRVDKSRNSDTGGTGLGLAIVKHIIVSHQGRVEVNSTLSRGSSFLVFLPLVK